MSEESTHAVTAILEASDANDGAEVFDEVIPVVYDELHAMAHAMLLRERKGHTLNTTALVHEAFFKLVDQDQVTSDGRALFFGAAARAMRQVLVDYARRRNRKKRGGSNKPITLTEGQIAVDELSVQLMDLDAALDKLETEDERAARVVECRFFAGLTIEEAAEALDVSPMSVKRDWAWARAWLFRELDG